MREEIKSYIDSTFKAFEQYENSRNFTSEINALKDKFIAFADRYPDLGSYLTNIPASDLYTEYTALMTKIVMAGYAEQREENTAPVKVSVRDYLEQYRPAYNEIVKDPTRPRGKKAYEDLFGIADVTDDMITAQLIIEKNYLIWNLTYWDSMDIYESRLKDMDPLYRATTAAVLNSIAALNASSSAEELYYYSSKYEIRSLKDSREYIAKMNAAIMTALRLTEYCSLKRDFYILTDPAKKKAVVKALMIKRENIKRVLTVTEKVLGMSFEDIIADEGIMIWLLNPQTKNDAKSLGKARKTMHPQNLEVFGDVLKNEIYSDLTIAECLMRKPPKIFWYMPKDYSDEKTTGLRGMLFGRK